EVEGTAAVADPGHGRADLHDVTGPQRRPELYVRVGGEQALVAIGTDAQLGGHVTEEGKRVRPVDEVAGIVGVAVRDVPAVRDHQSGARHAARRAWRRATSACTR